MAEVTRVSGKSTMADYTPSGAVAAGEVVPLAVGVGIADLAIASGTLGSLATNGGIFRGTKTAGSSTAVPGGTKLYWDNSGNKPTTSSGGNKVLGRATPDGAADDDTTIDFELDPAA